MKNNLQEQKMEPCYFYVDYSENKDKGKIRPLCLKCGHKRKGIWYWDKGSAFTIRCYKCDKLIYEVRNTNIDPQQPPINE